MGSSLTEIPRGFDERQEYYVETWGHHIDCSWKKNINHLLSVFHLLQFSRIKTVVELGCSDGGLATEIMNAIHYEVEWAGYDFMPNEIEASKKHPNYKAHLLEKFLWDMDEVAPFHVFVASHVLEHLYPEDVVALVEWLQNRAKILVLVAPLKPNLTPLNEGHIFPRGHLWVSDIIQSHGFKPVWETGRWFGWFVKK